MYLFYDKYIIVYVDISYTCVQNYELETLIWQNHFTVLLCLLP